MKALSPSLLWTTLYTILGACTLWYSGLAIQEILSYRRLSETGSATLHHVIVRPASHRGYSLQAEYSFEYDGQNYQGKSTVGTEYFRNRWVSEEKARELKGQTVLVWFNPKRPHQSGLQHAFPYRLCLYALLMLGLLGYAYGLRCYIRRLHH